MKHRELPDWVLPGYVEMPLSKGNAPIEDIAGVVRRANPSHRLRITRRDGQGNPTHGSIDRVVVEGTSSAPDKK